MSRPALSRPPLSGEAPYFALEYEPEGPCVHLLEQRELPERERYLRLTSADEVARAIKDMSVRGAPAIGIAAAWGVVLAARNVDAVDGAHALQALQPALARLNAARPTAVNLAWALRRLSAVLKSSGADWRERLASDAAAIETEDLLANRRMGQYGAGLITPGSGVLTHCNTGSLATAGFGTALGVIRAGVAERRIERVYAGETRPWNQGARLTVWELLQDGIPATLIADSAAAHLMATGAVQWVIVGADRITANGDVANKIGTLALAIAAKHFGVKLMVVAPSSTVDLGTAHGGLIEIEQRDPNELLSFQGRRTVADGVEAWNPVFDVTPAALVAALVTERGVIARPDEAAMRAAFGG